MKSILNNSLIVLITTSLLFSACSRKSTEGSTASRLPPPVARTLPSLNESVLNIPVKIILTPFLQQAELFAPREINSAGWPAYMQSGCDFKYKYRFVRSQFSFSCVNNKINVSMNGNYQIAGSKTVCVMNQAISPWINGSCGFGNESMRRVNINLISDLWFTPDYRLRTRTRVDKVQPIDKCLVTVFNNDVTQLVMDSIAASINFFGRTIDDIVNNMQFSQVIQPIAEKAGKKIPLSTYGYMKLNASAIKMGPINFIKDTLAFVAGISCFPEISSDSTNYSIIKYLPPLSTTGVGTGFNLSANAIYDYTTIDTLLTRTLRNRVFEVKGEKIQVQQVKVRGLDNYMVEFIISFTGSKKGTLYLKGTPQLDVASQVLSVPDLEYDLNSSSLALVLGKTFFSQRILDNLRRQATINVADLYQKNKQKIDTQFNREITSGIEIKGATDQLRLTGLVIKKDNVQVQVNLVGNSNLVIHRLPGF